MRIILLSTAALALSFPAMAEPIGHPFPHAYEAMTRDAPRQTTYGEAQVYRPRERSVRWLSEAYAPRRYFYAGQPRVVSGRDPF